MCPIEGEQLELIDHPLHTLTEAQKPNQNDDLKSGRATVHLLNNLLSLPKKCSNLPKI